MALTNDEIRAREGAEYEVIDNNYSARQIQASISAHTAGTAEAVSTQGGNIISKLNEVKEAVVEAVSPLSDEEYHSLMGDN